MRSGRHEPASASSSRPSAAHPLGTDRIGRDLLARLLYAGRVSLTVGLVAALFATGIGLVIGLIAGIFGGWVDTLMMRVTDVVLAIPALIAIAIVVGIVGTGLEIVVLFIALFTWPEAARMVRAVVLSLREQDFVLAARALGANNVRIMGKHLIFHALAPLTVTGTFTVAIALLTEASLSYLGIGVRPPQASWGNMLYDAQQLFILRDYPWYWVPPGLAIFITVLAVNLDRRRPARRARPARLSASSAPYLRSKPHGALACRRSPRPARVPRRRRREECAAEQPALAFDPPDHA